MIEIGPKIFTFPLNVDFRFIMLLHFYGDELHETKVDYELMI